MKHLNILGLALLVIFLYTGYANACSGYVVYSNETLYGMNYDDGSRAEMYVSIQKEGDMKYFLLYFYQGNRLCAVTGMNTSGCFVTLQMDSPDYGNGKSQKPEMLLPNLAIYYLRKGTALNYAEKLLKENYIINPAGWILHSILADANGRAMILEVGRTDNIIIPNEKNFHVMTNFHNGDFIGKDYRDTYGPGSDRYKSVYKAIVEKMGQFTLETGFAILKDAAQFTTRASMLFYPKKGEIYLVLNHDFSRILKISLEKETVETYRGFKKTRSLKLDDNGAAGTTLSKWN